MKIKTKRHRNNIRRVRLQLAMRQLDIARKLNVYQSEISQIERSEREPGVYLAIRIAKVLRRTVEEIF